MINNVFGTYFLFFIFFTQVVKLLCNKYCTCVSNQMSILSWWGFIFVKIKINF